MDREYKRRLEQLFADFGVTNYRYEHGGKHPLLIARHGDAYLRIAVPSSGSDWRGPANFIAYLKRTLNLNPRPCLRSPPHHRARCAIRQSRAPLALRLNEPSISSKPTWQDVLAERFGAPAERRP